MKNPKTARTIGSVILTVLLFVVALITIVPFLWMFISSFAPNSEIVKINGGLFPTPSTLDNYVSIQENFNFLRLFGNSVFVATVKTVIIIYTSALLGFVFAKMRFFGRDFLFAIVMSTMMIPWAVTIIPQYEMMVSFGWLDSYKALIIPGLVSGFGIFLFRQSISGISDELIEAARLDGASDTRIFHSLILPLSHNTIAALAIFTFLWNWEDYLWPFLMITDESKQLLAVGLKAFNGQYGTDYGGLFAATSLAIVPVIIVYMVFQKQFIAGIATGSSK
ncbi:MULTISPECIES: carbohydrate ABC transporter permease [Alloscardovia]|uniref:Carbohydrate ABC transporter permease n=1 Tax=Alloscardovia omnicolens TaxID=419015 RepID=A0A2I1J430_9BIFI|nr:MULTISPECIES: carbohydrate ABC transporter permease [Alloscardovia]MBS6346708.1 carbohydrate ABC transporter permease [Alloscardovia omnicolens]MDK6445422.1 carbohydrate ABC transporter permease [Alloscardovia omnicolens]MDK6663962.1 carbohydrate ABC transporter permease [Alloscardovia omnicolens]MDK7748319.1 carbohydrate ABC transporter permease [Alloscardovia omnicolens]MDK8649826.1 carbohydrate ABC transporter permease [Alloscardovia omnicolens]